MNIRVFSWFFLGAAALTFPVLNGITAQRAAVQATAPIAVFSTHRVEGTRNVYVFRYDHHQAMFIVTGQGVIATDPIGYGEPDAVTTYLSEIRKITNEPIKYVIYSHHHLDHISGGKSFKDAGAIFVAQTNAKRRLERIQDPYTVIPDETVDDFRTIRLGDTVLELSYVGPNHSDSSLVMRLPKEKIIFVADVIPVGVLVGQAFYDAYPLGWEESLKKVLAMDWDRMIPGHPPPGGRYFNGSAVVDWADQKAFLGTRHDAIATLEFLQYVSNEVKKPAQDGECWGGVERDIKLDRYAQWPGYPDFVPAVLRMYCKLWGRGTE
ncbi:MAG: MBL fold metallo-hydrolase [Steroidobacteraceae bacterium]